MWVEQQQQSGILIDLMRKAIVSKRKFSQAKLPPGPLMQIQSTRHNALVKVSLFPGSLPSYRARVP